MTTLVLMYYTSLEDSRSKSILSLSRCGQRIQESRQDSPTRARTRKLEDEQASFLATNSLQR